jgi:hypothetical protein
VRWLDPEDKLLARAVAIDNEPEPFWTGHDEVTRINDWKVRVGYSDTWGSVKKCGRLNGSSGDWVEKNILEPLHVKRAEAWITDCLDTYFESNPAATRQDSEPITDFVRRMGIPRRHHRPHPSEDEIVQMALAEHLDRLTAELLNAHPECVVTLGNAALRVFQQLVDGTAVHMQKLSTKGYGQSIAATIGGRQVEWLPLAHPAAPPIYQQAHKIWGYQRQFG